MPGTKFLKLRVCSQPLCNGRPKACHQECITSLHSPRVWQVFPSFLTHWHPIDISFWGHSVKSRWQEGSLPSTWMWPFRPEFWRDMSACMASSLKQDLLCGMMSDVFLLVLFSKLPLLYKPIARELWSVTNKFSVSFGRMFQAANFIAFLLSQLLHKKYTKTSRFFNSKLLRWALMARDESWEGQAFLPCHPWLWKMKTLISKLRCQMPHLTGTLMMNHPMIMWVMRTPVAVMVRWGKWSKRWAKVWNDLDRTTLLPSAFLLSNWMALTPFRVCKIQLLRWETISCQWQWNSL